MRYVRICPGADCDEEVSPHTIRTKAYGLFVCKKCCKQWSSAHTYANTFQKCKSCNAEVLPYKLDPLKFSGVVNNGNSPHMESLCEKCIKLGHRCFQIYDSEADYDYFDNDNSVEDDSSHEYDDDHDDDDDEFPHYDDDTNDVINLLNSLSLRSRNRDTEKSKIG